MDLSHIFYKVRPADGGSIFSLTLHLGKNNEIEEVLLKEDQKLHVYCHFNKSEKRHRCNYPWFK